jgi:hypothetical protein
MSSWFSDRGSEDTQAGCEAWSVDSRALAFGACGGDTHGVRIDLTFAGEYELRARDGIDPPRVLAYEYPPGTAVDVATLERPDVTIIWSVGDSAVESDPMVWPAPIQLDVRPADTACWLGIFQAQLLSPRGASCAVALPDRDSVAVLSHGAAYRVWASDPTHWDELSPGGVMQPVVVDALELVLFVEHTTITAYGSHGLAWRSEQLVWDDLEAVAVDGEHLQATGFDAPRNEIVPLTVDLSTGRSQNAPHPRSRLT